MDCASEASARAEFERIGNKCGWSLAGEQALAGVKDQLASSKRPSLLVLDTCDDVGTDYSRYIPNGSKVSVILTTRLSDAKKYASVDPQDAKSRLFFKLDGLDAGSAVHLLLDASDVQERSPQTTDRGRRVVAALDCHPLAITIASSLIRSGVYSLEEYVDALQERLTQRELLDTQSEQARYRRVSTTFEVSAEALQDLASTDLSAQAALSLLNVLGFMHHQDISEEIFVRAWRYEETVLSEFGGADGDEDGDITHLSAWHVMQSRSVFSSSQPNERKRLFRQARAHLERLSLVSIDRARNCTSLHLMVHAWARERVSRPSEVWSAAASILALSAEECTSWQPFTPQLVLHHKANFAIWKDESGLLTSQWSLCRIWYAYAWQLCRAQSTHMLRTCCQLLEQTQELCHGCSNQSAFMEAKYLLSVAYQANGQVSAAIETLEDVVKVQEKLAEDHPIRLASQHELARAYQANGQISEAVEMLEHVVKVREKLAENHPSRLTSQHELAGAYLANRQISEAVAILKHVVRVQEKLVEDHPHRLASQHELARAYDANGQISEAIELLKLVVMIKQRKFRASHPDRTVSEDLLASMMRMQENKSVSRTKRTKWRSWKTAWRFR